MGKNASFQAAEIEEILKESKTGVWKIELFTDKNIPPKMWADASTRNLLGIEGEISPEDCYTWWFERVLPEYAEIVSCCVNEIAQRGFGEVYYLWKQPSGKIVYVRCGGVRKTETDKSVTMRGTHKVVSSLNGTELENEEGDIRGTVDRITGLMDKSYFVYLMHRELKRHTETEYYLVHMDLEKFKMINATYGVEEGDRVLKFLANQIREMKSKNSICARMGGDRFAIFFPCREKELFENMQKLQKRLEEYPLNTRIVIKYGIYKIEDRSIEEEQMCDMAKLACDSVKGQYDKNYAFYRKTLIENLEKEQFVTDNMQQALEENQFEVFYQPIYRAVTEKVTAAEVLVRWKNPEKGYLPPSEFIPIFEKNGFIYQMDLYVLEQTCKNICACKTNGLPGVPVSVNLSQIDFYADDCLEKILGILEKYQVKSTDIRFEITESACNDDFPNVLRIVEELRKKGFQILMDDFGSGYSTLNVLKDIDIDVLKIDMKFFQNFESSPKAAVIVAAIIRMAKNLKIQVIAEGVEMESQFAFLKQLDCDKIQGYLFAKPVSFKTYQEKYLNEQVEGDADYFDAISQIDVDGFSKPESMPQMAFEEMEDAAGVVELFDNRMRLIKANPRMNRMLGKAGFGSLREIAMLLEEEEREELQALFLKAKQIHGVQTTQVKLSRIWYELKIRYVKESGNRTAFYVSCHNITSMKNLEKYQGLGSYLINLCGVYSRVDLIDFENDRIENLLKNNEEYFDIEKKGSIEKTIDVYAHSNLAENYQEKFRKLYQVSTLNQLFHEENSCSEVFRFKNREGNYKWGLVMMIRVSGEDEKMVCLSCVRNVNEEVLRDDLI